MVNKSSDSMISTKSIEWINLDDYVRNNTIGDVYYIRVQGNSCDGLGIFNGDLLVVDREKKPEYGNLIISQIGNDVIIHTYQKKSKLYLASSEGKKIVQSKHKPILFKKEPVFWATVSFIVRNVVASGGNTNAKKWLRITWY